MASTWLVFTFGVCIYHGYQYHTVYIRDGLIIRNESFIFITVKTHESACRHLQKTMLMHKIATPWPAVELAKVHRAILLHDAAPVRSRRDCRIIACSCGILSGNLCHESNSVRGFVRSRNNLGRLGLTTLTYDAGIQNSSSLSSSISSKKLDAIVHPHLIRV